MKIQKLAAVFLVLQKYAELKPRPNGHNISTQHIATLSGVRHVAKCCAMLGVVGSNLKMVKFFMQHLWMLHDVVVVWPGSCNNLAPGHAHLFDFQYPTCRNTSQQGGQHVAPNNVAICCIEILQSFGRSLQMLGQQCWNMLWLYVAIVWPGLYNHFSLLLLLLLCRGCQRNVQRSITHVQSHWPTN